MPPPYGYIRFPRHNTVTQRTDTTGSQHKSYTVSKAERLSRCTKCQFYHDKSITIFYFKNSHTLLVIILLNGTQGNFTEH
jgi:hypothetical protein